MQGKEVKAYELRKKDDDALVAELTKYRKELASLRVSKVSAAPQVKLARIKLARKAIAKVLTVINEKRIHKARDTTKKHKYTPLDLRVKKTRAYRKRLTKHERSLKVPRVAKRNANFKARKFALAA